MPFSTLGDDVYTLPGLQSPVMSITTLLVKVDNIVVRLHLLDQTFGGLICRKDFYQPSESNRGPSHHLIVESQPCGLDHPPDQVLELLIIGEYIVVWRSLAHRNRFVDLPYADHYSSHIQGPH